jgi:hypothetical protein
MTIGWESTPTTITPPSPAGDEVPTGYRRVEHSMPVVVVTVGSS